MIYTFYKNLFKKEIVIVLSIDWVFYIILLWIKFIKILWQKWGLITKISIQKLKL